MSSGCNALVGAHFKIDALLGRPFLEHDADGVNDFLVHWAPLGMIMSSRASLSQHGACM
jgi:hypothetical protein